jgi:uncharacterized protein
MLLDSETLTAQARGCAVLGAGGGGSPDVGLLAARHAVAEHGPVPVVDLDDLPDDGLVMPCGSVGAPTISLEKLGNPEEGVWLREHVERLTGRAVVAVMAAEIGGSNGLAPVAWAARMGLPMVDADGMGRAFPEMQQVSMHVAGIRPDPCVLTDERGNVSVLYPENAQWLERMCRAMAVAFGGSATSAEYLMTAEQARTATVRGTVTRAVTIGRLLGEPGGDPVRRLLGEVGGTRLVEGKITDVDRSTTGGFELQNENLVAFEDGRVRACVPDIITVLDTQTADAITTEVLRYGLRVSVVAFPCAPLWRTPAGLATVGPRAFGYDFDYTTVEDLHGVHA